MFKNWLVKSLDTLGDWISSIRGKVAPIVEDVSEALDNVEEVIEDLEESLEN